MFETEDYNSVYTMADLEHNAILTDKCAIHFFELPKLDKNIDSNNRKKLWMQLINSESEGDLEMLKNAEVPAIKNGVDVIFKLSDDKEVRDMAERREDAIKTEKSALYHAKIAGKAEGRVEGEAIGIVKGIESMIDGMRAAGLTEEQIEAVRKAAR